MLYSAEAWLSGPLCSRSSAHIGLPFKARHKEVRSHDGVMRLLTLLLKLLRTRIYETMFTTIDTRQGRGWSLRGRAKEARPWLLGFLP